MDSFVTAIGSSLLRSTPELIVWLVGSILAVLMVRRGGGKAEKLFLSGCALMFAVDLINPLLRELVRWWMSERDVSNIATAQTMGLASLPMAILSLAGVICLVWAFWTRFWTRRPEAA